MEEINLGGERIFLKKDRLGWRVVHPIKIDGKINWKNFLFGGSYIKPVITLGFLFIVLMAMQEYVNTLRLVTACLRALPDYIDLTPYILNPELNSSIILP